MEGSVSLLGLEEMKMVVVETGKVVMEMMMEKRKSVLDGTSY